MTDHRGPATVLFASLLACGLLAGCGDDDDEAGTTTTSVEPAEPTAPADGEPTEDTGPLPDACELVPDAAGVSGLQLGPGTPDGDDRRRVCAFSATEPGQVGLTVAVQGGGLFEEKAEQSENALGQPGESIDGVGDEALFFFSDDDLPEGVGGILVGVGDLTIDVTLQDIDEDAMRTASTAIAEHALANL